MAFDMALANFCGLISLIFKGNFLMGKLKESGFISEAMEGFIKATEKIIK